MTRMQFRLWHVFVAIVVFGCAMALASAHWHGKLRERAVVAALRERKIAVLYEYQQELDEEEQDDGNVAPGPAWLRSLLGDDFFTSVKSVNAAHTFEGSDAVLCLIGRLPQVRRLNLLG